MFPFFIPWNDITRTFVSQNTPESDNAGSLGFVNATEDGHLKYNGERIRFWGVNVCYGSAFPEKEDAPIVAAHLAKYGVNMVRFHHMDMMSEPRGIWTVDEADRTLSKKQLDKLDYFIFQLKKQGIFTNLNLLVSRPFKKGSELDDDIEMVAEWKVRAALGFFDEKIVSLQKKYATDLLLHKNPYTGNSYAQEPAVACIEINNENGMLHEFLSGSFDRLPDYYGNELRARWRAWLSSHYTSVNQLREAWQNQESAVPSEVLQNGDFSKGLQKWSGEQHFDAKASFSISDEGYDGARTAVIDIKNPGEKGWHVQFNQPGITVERDLPYTLTFAARSSVDRIIEVSIAMAHEPWSALGLRKEIVLKNEWQVFSISGISLRPDANARLNFSNMGLVKGQVEIGRVSLRSSGTVGLKENENPFSGNMPLFTRTEYGLRNEAVRRDWIRFLLDTEEKYWTGMRNFLKEDLRVKQLLIGTIVGCSTPNLMSQFDIIDTHAYWTHPVFPGGSWDPNDWYVENRAMVNSPGSSTVADLSMRSVLNKPHAVTEYNHPHPNTFEAESFYFLSMYASLQDWDMVLPFTYSHRGNEWETQYIPNYFDIDQNPVKMVSMLPAAKAFTEYHIRPADKTVMIPFTKDDEYTYALSAYPWSLVSAASAGVPVQLGLIHKIRLNTGGTDALSDRSQLELEDLPEHQYISDTGEIQWHLPEPGKAYVLLSSSKSVFAVGFLQGKTISTDALDIKDVESIQQGFAAISVTSMDGEDIAVSQKLLITVLGAQDNSGRNWFAYRDTQITFPPSEGEKVTLTTAFGVSPSMLEAVKARIILKGKIPAHVRGWALGQDGEKADTVKIAGMQDAEIFINGDYGTPWFAVEIGDFSKQ